MSSRLGGFFGGKKEVDHYELKVKTGRGGWKNPAKEFHNFETDLEDLDDLDEPLEKAIVENTAESEGWPAGTYVMQAKGTDGSVVGYEWKDLIIEADDDEPAEPELSPIEELREDFRAMRAEMDGAGRISSPDDAYGRVFEAMMSGEEMNPEAIGALRQFLQEWQATTQDPPSSPGEFAGRIAQQRFEAGDTEGAVSLLDGWFQAEQPGDTGGLLASALEGDVELDGSVGLLELAGLDAYTRMEPALDRIATSVGDQAADAVAGAEPDNILTQALAEGSRRREEDAGEPAEPALDVEDVEQPADVDESGPSRSSGDVAELSEGFGGPKPEAPADDAPAAPATASAGPSEPEITADDAEQLADDVAAAVGGSD